MRKIRLVAGVATAQMTRARTTELSVRLHPLTLEKTMHSTVTAAAAAPRPLPQDYVFGGIFRLYDSLLKAYRIRATRAQLHELTDRELDDIGLSRAEIDNLALKGLAR